MSEKRFACKVKKRGDIEYVLFIDTKEEVEYMSFFEIIDLVNKLNDENIELKRDLEDYGDANATLEAEILKLRQQLTDCEKFRNQIFKKMEEMQQDEKLYAQEIIRLNKEVKDNQFLRLGNDY